MYVACIPYVIHFLWLNNILLYVYTTICPSVQLALSLFFFFDGLGFELRALHLDRCSTT
jgi:hypothetical protein